MSHEARNLRDAPDKSRVRPPLLGIIVVILLLAVVMFVLQSRDRDQDPTTVLAEGGCFTYSFSAAERIPFFGLDEVEAEVRASLSDEDLGNIHWAGYGQLSQSFMTDSPVSRTGYEGRRWVLIFEDPDEDDGWLTSILGRNGDPRFTVIYDPSERQIDRTCDDEETARSNDS